MGTATDDKKMWIKVGVEIKGKNQGEFGDKKTKHS